MTRSIDRSRMQIKENAFEFVPLRPPAGKAVPLAQAGLNEELDLLVFSRGGQHRALIVREMAYHHIAQGKLAGEPWLVTF